MFNNLLRKADLGVGGIFLGKCLKAFCLLILNTERESSIKGKWIYLLLIYLDQQITPTARATGPVPSTFHWQKSYDLNNTKLK